MKKTAFVTGATGFLGLNLVELLLKNGWKVIAFHRPSSNLKYLDQFDVEKKVGNIDDLDSLRQSMPEEVDVVFHVAANTSAWKRQNAQQYQDNVIGTRNMVQCALKKKAHRFIYTSSISAFGFPEGLVNESTPSNAMESGVNYLVTKYLAEQEVKEGIRKGLDAVILNPNHIIGPYDSHNWAQVFISIKENKLPGIPPGRGMYGYVKDIAQAHINAVDRGRSGENYLLGGIEANFEQVVNIIQKLMGRKPTHKIAPIWLLQAVSIWYSVLGLFSRNEPTLTPEKVKFITKKIKVDDNKARQELGFTSVPLEKMVKAEYEWLKQQGKI